MSQPTDIPAIQSRPRSMRLLTLAAFVVTAWLAVTFSFTPLRTSQDEFWQLKTGQWITNHGLPKNDIFTYTAENIRWDNHEWLSQVILWRVYQAGEASEFGGLRAVILFKTLIILLAFGGFGALLGWRMRQPVWAALAAALALALARRTFYPRPPFITYLLMALTLWLLIEWRVERLRTRWLALILIPLYVLWDNLHGGWLAGLTLIGAFCANQTWLVILHRRGVRPATAPERRLIALALIMGGCVLATLANPFGYHLWELPGRVAQDPFLARQIGEMAPTDWHFVWVLEGVILLMAAAAIRPVTLPGLTFTACWLLALHLALRGTANHWVQTVVALPVLALAIWWLQRPGWVAHLLLVCFYAYQAIHHVRHLSLLAIVILPSLAWGLESWSEALSARWANRQLSRPPAEREALAARLRRGAVWVGLLILIALATFWTFNPLEGPSFFQRNLMLAGGQELQPAIIFPRPGDWPAPSLLPAGAFLVESADYAVQAVKFIERARLPGRLWNGGNYAGYLIWRLAPEKYKLFTDNRYDIYGGQFLRDEHSVLEGWTRPIIDSPKFMNYLQGLGVKSRDGCRPWDEVLDSWGAQTVILPVTAWGNARLAAAGWGGFWQDFNQVTDGWVRVYEDFSYNVWVRDTPENQAIIARAQDLPRPNPWLARGR